MEYTWNFTSVFAYWNVLAIGLLGTVKLFIICTVLGLGGGQIMNVALLEVTLGQLSGDAIRRGFPQHARSGADHLVLLRTARIDSH